MKKLSEVISVGKLVGSRGAAFRKASTSKPDDWRDTSGKDIGAMRNFAHEKAAVAKAAASKRERESIVNKRNQDAAQRAKETLRMAKEDLEEAKGKFVYDKPLKANVAAMDKHSTDALKGMHDRWASDHKDMKSNPAHSERLLAAHHVLKNRGISVPDLPQHKNLGMVKRFTAESTESTGTEARVKIKNVARPNDAAPTSEKSLLSRNGEIKVKKVDEEIAASISRKYGLSDSVLEAARAVMEKKTQVDLDPTTDDKEDNGDDDDVKKESKHTTPKSDKEKKLAALAHPKDKITHKDVLVGRGVLKKEETEIDEKTLYGNPAELKRQLDQLAKREKALPPGISPARKALAIQKQKLQKAHSDAMGMKKEEVELEDTKLSYDDFTKGARRAGTGSTDELIASLKKKRSGPGSRTVRKLDKVELKGRVTTAKEETEIDSLTEEQLEEVLKKSQPAGEWIKDFVHSKDPKFAGKSKKERMKMALGAYYAKQRNEEVEEVDEAIKPYVSYSAASMGKSPSATVMAANEKPHKTFTKAEHGHDYKQKAIDYFKKHGNKLKENIEFSFSEEEIKRLEAIAAQLDEAKPTVSDEELKASINKKRAGPGSRTIKKLDRNELMRRAVKEEVEQIDEISKNKMWSYAMDAKGEIERDRARAGKPDWDYTNDKLSPEQIKRHKKRMKGLSYAAHKLSDVPVPDGQKIFNKEEVELDEARGRPKKSGEAPEGDDTAKHPIQQLHKIAAAMQGNEPHFEHKDGSKTKVSKQLAKHITAVYGSMRTTQDKEDFANKLHANRDSMMSAVSKHVR